MGNAIETSMQLETSQNQLMTLNQEYEKLAEQSHFDSSWETDYQAALLVPAAIMLGNITNFEPTFDRIIFHLDGAITKTNEKGAQTAISRTLDDLFSKIIYIIQVRIDEIKKENERGMIEKAKTAMTTIGSKLSDIKTFFKKGGPVGLAITIGPEVGSLLGDFLQYFNNEVNRQKDVNIFYNQLAHVYQKIIDSKSFNSDYGLIRNTFTRNKEDILRHVVWAKGITAGRNLFKYDINQSEIQDSERIVACALAEKQSWDEVILYLGELKEEKVPHYRDIENMVLENFEFFESQKYMKGLTKVFKTKLKKAEQKKVDKAKLLFKLKLDGKYDEYLSKQKTIKIVIFTVIILSIIALIVFA